MRTSINTIMVILFAITILSACKEKDDPGPVPPVTPPPPATILFKANAGTDLTLYVPNNVVILDGSSSQDSRKVVISYVWEKIISANANLKLSESIRFDYGIVPEGVHLFRLVASDRQGNTSADTVQVTVIDNFAIGIAPTMDILCDTIVKAVNESYYQVLEAHAFVDSADIRYDLYSGFKFTQVSGPSQATLVQGPLYRSNVVQAHDLVAGDYVFKVEVERKGMKASANMVLMLRPDTARGKEYLYESVWKDVQDPFSISAIAQVNDITSLIPLKEGRELKVFIADEGVSTWTEVSYDWWGSSPYWFLDECGNSLMVYQYNLRDRALMNKKLKVKVRVVN